MADTAATNLPSFDWLTVSDFGLLGIAGDTKVESVIGFIINEAEIIKIKVK
ncbi:hypothetical protein ACFOEE_06530 [Pseudoalteromonas fenneropenaei]|uniref:Uncharacterized protein n=1 Tax=Pseudoalteromonas fenneropenaei TaxID=1737459 RepID=A0ABV7CHM1_9GAMM